MKGVATSKISLWPADEHDHLDYAANSSTSLDTELDRRTKGCKVESMIHPVTRDSLCGHSIVGSATGQADLNDPQTEEDGDCDKHNDWMTETGPFGERDSLHTRRSVRMLLDESGFKRSTSEDESSTHRSSQELQDNPDKAMVTKDINDNT